MAWDLRIFNSFKRMLLDGQDGVKASQHISVEAL